MAVAGFFLASLLIAVESDHAWAYTSAWNETSPTSRTNNPPSGIVKTMTGDIVGDGVESQIVITSSKELWVGSYTDPLAPTVMTWSNWTPASFSGLSLATLTAHTYLGDGDPLRQLGGAPNPLDFVIRADLTIIVPAGETGSGSPEFWFYHSTGTGFESPDKSSPGVYTGDRIITGDYNGDARMDFLFIDQSSLTWKVVAGSLTQPTMRQTYAVAATWLTGKGGGEQEVVGDFLGRGIDDVAVFVAGTWYVAVGSPTYLHNTFAWETWLTGATKPDLSFAADVTGTGYESIIGVHDSAEVWDVLVSGAPSGTHAFTNAPQSLDLGLEKALIPADANGDGLRDILVVTDDDTPKVVVSSMSAGAPVMTLVSSSVSVGTVEAAYATYFDANDSSDLFLSTSTGSFVVTAKSDYYSSTRVVHLNAPARGDGSTTCTLGTYSDLCAYITRRDGFVMPNRIPFYVKSIHFARDIGTFNGRSLGDDCFYVLPKRYTVAASDDGPNSPNREEHCSTVEKGTGDAMYPTGVVTFPGNGLLVPGDPDATIQMQASSFSGPTPPAASVIVRFTATIKKAASNPSNLVWVLRLPEADIYEYVGPGTEANPNVVTLTQVPYGTPGNVNHTEWGNTGTCDQHITGLSFYNSFDQSIYHSEAALEIYVKHPDASVDHYPFTPVEYKGDDGTSSGSYTSRNQVVFENPILIAPGDIVGEKTVVSRFGNETVYSDSAFFLHMVKETDVNCGP